MGCFVVAALLAVRFCACASVAASAGFAASPSFPVSSRWNPSGVPSAVTMAEGRDATVHSALSFKAQDDGGEIDNTRQAALRTMASIPFILVQMSGSHPAHAKSGIKPEVAFANLLKGREELVTASKKYLSSKDYDGMRTYLTDDAVNMNNFESNALALLESKQLDAESKKEIGTIRRYGVGADVMIMYGGLKAEVADNDEPNYAEVQKYLRRTVDSLDEVIAICRSNGF